MKRLPHFGGLEFDLIWQGQLGLMLAEEEPSLQIAQIPRVSRKQRDYEQIPQKARQRGSEAPATIPAGVG